MPATNAGGEVTARLDLDISKLKAKLAEAQRELDKLTKRPQVVTLDARTRAAERAVDRVRGSMDATGRSSRRASHEANNLWTTLRKASFVFVGVMALKAALEGVSGSIRAVVQEAMRFEQMTITFEHFYGSAERAREELSALADFAARTPFELRDIEQQALRLRAYGFAASDVVPLLTDVGDAVAALGTGAEGINRITLALGQMRSAGRANSRDMLQLTEALIPAWRYLAEALGKTEGEVRQLTEKGLIPARLAIAAIRYGMARDFGGLMERQMGTAAQQWANLADAATLAARNIGKEVLPFIKDVVARLMEAMPRVEQFILSTVRGTNDLGRALRNVAAFFSFIATALTPVLHTFKQSIEIIIAIIAGDLPSAIEASEGNIMALGGAIGIMAWGAISVLNNLASAWLTVSEAAIVAAGAQKAALAGAARLAPVIGLFAKGGALLALPVMTTYLLEAVTHPKLSREQIWKNVYGMYPRWAKGGVAALAGIAGVDVTPERRGGRPSAEEKAYMERIEARRRELEHQKAAFAEGAAVTKTWQERQLEAISAVKEHQEAVRALAEAKRKYGKNSIEALYAQARLNEALRKAQGAVDAFKQATVEGALAHAGLGSYAQWAYDIVKRGAAEAAAAQAGLRAQIAANTEAFNRMAAAAAQAAAAGMAANALRYERYAMNALNKANEARDRLRALEMTSSALSKLRIQLPRVSFSGVGSSAGRAAGGVRSLASALKEVSASLKQLIERFRDAVRSTANFAGLFDRPERRRPRAGLIGSARAQIRKLTQYRDALAKLMRRLPADVFAEIAAAGTDAMDDVIRLARSGIDKQWAALIRERNRIATQVTRMTMGPEIRSSVRGIIGSGINRALGRGGEGNVIVNINGAITIRGDADIKRIGRRLAIEVRRELRAAGVM